MSSHVAPVWRGSAHTPPVHWAPTPVHWGATVVPAEGGAPRAVPAMTVAPLPGPPALPRLLGGSRLALGLELVEGLGGRLVRSHRLITRPTCSRSHQTRGLSLLFRGLNTCLVA